MQAASKPKKTQQAREIGHGLQAAGLQAASKPKKSSKRETDALVDSSLEIACGQGGELQNCFEDFGYRGGRTGFVPLVKEIPKAYAASDFQAIIIQNNRRV